MSADISKLDAYWMPFTANRQFKQAPRLLTQADGMFFRDDKGREVLDGILAHNGEAHDAVVEPQTDKTWAMRVDLLNRRIEYAGFAPRLSLIYVKKASSIALYRYSRFQLQIGLTRQF